MDRRIWTGLCVVALLVMAISNNWVLDGISAVAGTGFAGMSIATWLKARASSKANDNKILAT